MGKGIKKRLDKKKIAAIVAIVMGVLLTVLPIVSDDAFGETATGSKVTYKGAISSMGSTCGKFTIKGRDAFCADHSAPTPPTGTKITATKLTTKAAMRKALYYGYGGPKAKVNKNNAGWVSTSIALSRANGNGGGTTEAQKFYKKLKNYDTPPDSFKVYYCTTSGDKQNLCYWIYEPEGKIKLKKESANEKATEDKGYDLAGAVYGVYTEKECNTDSEVAKLTTNSTGVTNEIVLDEATYYVKEIEAPKGFKLNPTVYTVVVTDQCDSTIVVTDEPEEAQIQIIKTSAEPNKTVGNEGYSLAGAQYGIWSDKSLTISEGVLTTNGEGKSNIVSVLAGKYYIKEIMAPKGYLKDEKVYEVEIGIGELGELEVLEVQDIPEEDLPWILLQKVDSETGEPAASGDGTLEGAEFTVKYYEGTDWNEDPAKSGAEDEGEWVFKTNKNGYIRFDDKEQLASGDELYYNNLGNPTLPIGTITIQETKAPKGYVRNDEVFIVKILNDDNESGVSLSQIPTTEVKQKPIRGDIEIMKSDSKTGKKLADISFDIIDKSENRVVATLTTDEKGYATTASKEKPAGSLLYGEYIVREKDAPKGYLPGKDIDVVIDDNGEVVSLEIKNIPAEIDTEAAFGDSGTKESTPQEIMNIVDKVSYVNLIPGETYKLKAILMDKSTEKPFVMEGKEVIAETEFTAEESSGTINMEFVLNGRILAGKALTVFEHLYIDDTLVASHADIDDMNQTVRVLPVGNIEIYKGDSHTGEPLEGVEFEIIDGKSGETLAVLVTDENGYATTAADETLKLLYGDYIVRETEPLPGYMAIEDLEVTLDSFNKIMSLKIDNTPIVMGTADTGDLMGRTLPLAIALLCIASIGVIVVTKKKKERR